MLGISCTMVPRELTKIFWMNSVGPTMTINANRINRSFTDVYKRQVLDRMFEEFMQYFPGERECRSGHPGGI